MYPIIKNCNFERDDEILKAVKAVEKGWTQDDDLISALDSLEETLTEHADSEYVNSVNACREAESRVRERYEQIAAEVDASRESSW